MIDLKDLAREYAALVPEWLRPGMAFLEYGPGCDSGGDQWRGMPSSWVAFSKGNDARIEHVSQHREAIAAGPDLADNATLGALLLGLPKVRVSGALGPSWQEGWIVTCDNNMIQRCSESLAEAIIRACIARAKAVGK